MTHPLDRRALLGGAGLSLSGLGLWGLLRPGAARAQAARPITLVVPYAAGGGTDIAARDFAQGFGQALGRTVVVDNRGGAAGHVGSASVARARPDGTTLLFAVSTNVVVNPHLQRGDRIDLATALAPVTQTAAYQYVLAVDPALGTPDLAALVERARRGDLSFSSGGVGSNNHMAGVLFAEAAGIRMEHVPYRGTGPALLDVMGGRVSLNFSSPPPAIPLVREGRLKALAVTGARRLAALPDVPTLGEAGMPGIVITGWHGLFAPAGTPDDLLARYEAAALEATAAPKFRERLEIDGLEPAPARPRTAFAAAVREESAFWGDKVRALGITLD